MYFDSIVFLGNLDVDPSIVFLPIEILQNTKILYPVIVFLSTVSSYDPTC